MPGHVCKMACAKEQVDLISTIQTREMSTAPTNQSITSAVLQ